MNEGPIEMAAVPQADPDVPTRPTTAQEARQAGLDRTLRSVSRGTAVMAAATIILVGLQFLTRVVVTRNVSGDQWGEFNLGLALANFLALVAAFGIPTATARSLAFEETYDARMALIRKALYVSLPVAVASSVLVYLLADQLASVFHAPELGDVFRLFSVSVGLTMLSNVLVGIFQGLERAEPNAIFIQIVNPSLFFLFTAIFVFAHWGFVGVLVGYTLSWVGAFAALALYSSRRLPALLRSVSSESFTGDATGRVSFVSLSVTLFGVATLAYLTSYADTILLGIFRPEDLVGQYSSAMNLTRLLLVGTGTVTFVYLPVTSRLRREQNYDGLRHTYVTVTRWMALLTLPFTFLFFFDPMFSLAFTFGPNQVGGSTALQILVLANTVAILLGPSTATLGGLGGTRSVLRFTVVSTVANFALCFLLIPPYGMIGAAIAWSTARLLFPLLALVQVYVEHGISPFHSHFVRPLALTTVLLVPLFWLLPMDPNVWLVPVLLLIPFVTFAAAILVTRSVDRGDIVFLAAAEGRVRFVRPIRRLLESRLVPERPEAKV
jgi:O-antigen/teichoic acid export membrane protein